MWKCPYCNEKIDTLQYSVCTSGREWGTAYLENREVEPCDRVTDHECDDSESGDWDGDTSYECPDCNHDLSEDELIWEDEPEIVKEKEVERKKQLQTEEETEHPIIRPISPIISCSEPKNSNNTTIICKKCKHVFVHDSARNETGGNSYAECSKCGELNSSDEFKKLLNEGFYS